MNRIAQCNPIFDLFVNVMYSFSDKDTTQQNENFDLL